MDQNTIQNLVYKYPIQVTQYQSITVSDIYGPGTITVPDGFEVTAFRVPEEGEIGINRISQEPFTWDRGEATGKPRLILQKKIVPQPRPYAGPYYKQLHIFDVYTNYRYPNLSCGDLSALEKAINDAGYEIIDFEVPRKDQLFWSTDGNPSVAAFNIKPDLPRLIIKKVGQT